MVFSLSGTISGNEAALFSIGGFSHESSGGNRERVTILGLAFEHDLDDAGQLVGRGGDGFGGASLARMLR